MGAVRRQTPFGRARISSGYASTRRNGHRRRPPAMAAKAWSDMQSSGLDSSVHLIQVALSPIFLLSGIAALLNLFAARLARVADRMDLLAADMRTGTAGQEVLAEVTSLHRRSVLLDLAVACATAGATMTCLAIVTLFFVGVGVVDAADVLLFFFGTAILCTLCSVVLFGWEMFLSSCVLRTRMHVHVPHLKLAGLRHVFSRR
jgi:hypothetical protein